jgi:methylenetetrahydrofolate/methylenetetrahydromethanopterin dehydrogenase (NADP+)
MRKLLLQLDTSRLASVFDEVVAYDAGADAVLARGGVTEADVRDLIYGCIFTRGLKDLKNTAVFIGGTEMAVGEQLLAAAQQTFFGPFRVSLLLDSNGSNTTAVAAVTKMLQAAGDVRGQKAVVISGTGPVGRRAAGLLAKAGANVVLTSRKVDAGEVASRAVAARFGGQVSAAVMSGAAEAARTLEGAALVFNAGAAGVQMIPSAAWAGRKGLRVAADVNAVPPLGIEGVKETDDGVEHEGARVFGALAIGGLKMKLHKACIARMFERNDLVFDVEKIADLAQELVAGKPENR